MNKEIKEWKEEHNITNGELAEVGEISPKSVSQFVNGKQTINSDVIGKWAEKWPAMMAYALHILVKDVEDAMWTAEVIDRKKEGTGK